MALPLTAWRRCWEGEVPIDRYRPLRIGVGVLLAVAVATTWPHAALFFGEDGLPAAQFASTGPHTLAILWGVPPHALLVVGIVGALGFAAGIFPRACGLVAFLIHFSLQQRNGFWADGSDNLVRCMLFWLLLAPLGRPGPAPIWPLRFCQLQVVSLYAASGLFKTEGSNWWNGTALYWVLSDARYQRFPLDDLLATPIGQFLCNVGTWGTLAVELSLPILLLVPRTRRIALVIGVAFHLGILATLRIGLFTPVVLVSYLAFLEPRPRR